MVRVRATKAQFSDDSDVSIPAEGMVLLVGPNNAGKSQVLKDLAGLAREARYVGRAILSVDYEKSVDGDIREWASRNVPQINREGVNRFQIENWGEVTSQDIANQWDQQNLNLLTSLFIFHADGTSRL